MALIITTPPASEPVSLAEAKAFLRVDHDVEDDLIATLIAAARDAVESLCGRALIARTLRETLDDWRLDGAGAALLAVGPVTSVVSAALLDAADEASVIDADDYRLDGAGDRPRLVFTNGAPIPKRRVGGVRIDYVAGIGAEAADLPANLRLAVLHVIAALYEAREGAASLPDAARALAAPSSVRRL